MAIVLVCDHCKRVTKTKIDKTTKNDKGECFQQEITNPAFAVRVEFIKEDVLKTKIKDRQMLEVKFDLCETCITQFLKDFGRFKARWLKQEEETQEKGTSDTLENLETEDFS